MAMLWVCDNFPVSGQCGFHLQHLRGRFSVQLLHYGSSWTLEAFGAMWKTCSSGKSGGQSIGCGCLNLA